MQVEDFFAQSDKFYFVKTDLQGRYKYANRAFMLKYGYLIQGNLIGKPFQETVYHADVGKCFVAAERCIKTGEQVSVRLRKPLPGKGLKWTYWEFIPVKQADEQVVELACLGIDITESQSLVERLESSQKLNRNLLENISDAVIIIDTKGRIESVNKHTLSVFGYREEELIGQQVEILMASERDANMHNHYISKYLQTGIKNIIGIGREVLAKRKSGQAFKAKLEIIEIEEGGQKKFIGMLRDVSLESDALLQIHRYAKTLEEIANFQSHYVRRPVANVLGLIQLIEFDKDEANRKKYLDMLKKSVEDLDEVIRETVRKTYMQ